MKSIPVIRVFYTGKIRVTMPGLFFCIIISSGIVLLMVFVFGLMIQLPIFITIQSQTVVVEFTMITRIPVI